MGGIIEIVLKAMIQDFSTVSSIEIEIGKKTEHFTSMVSFIDLDILNLWFYYDLQ